MIVKGELVYSRLI